MPDQDDNRQRRARGSGHGQDVEHSLGRQAEKGEDGVRGHAEKTGGGRQCRQNGSAEAVNRDFLVDGGRAGRVQPSPGEPQDRHCNERHGQRHAEAQPEDAKDDKRQRGRGCCMPRPEHGVQTGGQVSAPGGEEGHRTVKQPVARSREFRFVQDRLNRESAHSACSILPGDGVATCTSSACCRPARAAAVRTEPAELRDAGQPAPLQSAMAESCDGFARSLAAHRAGNDPRPSNARHSGAYQCEDCSAST